MRSVIKLPSRVVDEAVTVELPRYIEFEGMEYTRVEFHESDDTEETHEFTYEKKVWPKHVRDRMVDGQLRRTKGGG